MESISLRRPVVFTVLEKETQQRNRVLSVYEDVRFINRFLRNRFVNDVSTAVPCNCIHVSGENGFKAVTTTTQSESD